MTILGFLNFWLFQWFFIRLARAIDDETSKQVGWTILRWPCPMSGWDGRPYKWVGGKRKP